MRTHLLYFQTLSNKDGYRMKGHFLISAMALSILLSFVGCSNNQVDIEASKAAEISKLLESSAESVEEDTDIPDKEPVSSVSTIETATSDNVIGGGVSQVESVSQENSRGTQVVPSDSRTLIFLGRLNAMDSYTFVAKESDEGVITYVKLSDDKQCVDVVTDEEHQGYIKDGTASYALDYTNKTYTSSEMADTYIEMNSQFLVYIFGELELADSTDTYEHFIAPNEDITISEGEDVYVYFVDENTIRLEGKNSESDTPNDIMTLTIRDVTEADKQLFDLSGWALLESHEGE